MITQTPFRIENIRARRRKPGLMRQHLTAVKAAARVSNAHVEGAELGSTELVFEPGPICPGHYEFAVGTAGSTMLVLQTVLPALLLFTESGGESGGEPSEVSVEGGTHNMNAPVFEFLDRAFRPQMQALGAEVSFGLEQHGFYPAGGGRVRATIDRGFDPSASLELVERGRLESVEATALLAHLPAHIAEREFAALAEALDVPVDETRTVTLEESRSPGNTLIVDVASANVTEVFTGIGRKGVRAEEVGEETARAVNAYLAGGAPVGPYLADQLLLPMTITSGGVFRTSECTPHTATQLALIPRFVDVGFERIDDEHGTLIRVEK
jgi:RNA 3'-terminal phosphate cyclase (ATP)